VATVADTALLEQLAARRRAIAEHKTAIRRHRDRLHQDAAALAALEAECRRRGIRFTVHHPGEEDHSWPTHRPVNRC
jgi:hypothetical protein